MQTIPHSPFSFQDVPFNSEPLRFYDYLQTTPGQHKVKARSIYKMLETVDTATASVTRSLGHNKAVLQITTQTKDERGLKWGRRRGGSGRDVIGRKDTLKGT